MKSFDETLSSRLIRINKRILTKPVRLAVLRIPFLPASIARALDDIRFVEPDVLRFIINTVQQGWCCIDVGAHCGTAAVRLASIVSPGGHVVAVEPIAENADLLESNLRARGLSSLCATVRAAVGGKESQIPMVRGDHSTTWHKAGSHELAGDLRMVNVHRLDDICDGQRPPDFVKVDIEGAETELITGAQRLLNESRPIWLFEMHSPESWQLLGHFSDKNYRAFALDGAEIYPHMAKALGGYGHVVFCPREKISLLG